MFNYLPDTCFFNDGYMQGGSALYVSSKYDKYASDSESDCAMRVTYAFPEASGATWKGNETCWAEYGETLTNFSAVRTCQFLRTFFNYLTDFVIVKELICETIFISHSTIIFVSSYNNKLCNVGLGPDVR